MNSSIVTSVNQFISDTFGKAYNDAKARGDNSGMANAHAGAEAYRASVGGFLGGVDGSQVIPIYSNNAYTAPDVESAPSQEPNRYPESALDTGSEPKYEDFIWADSSIPNYSTAKTPSAGNIMGYVIVGLVGIVIMDRFMK